MMNLTLNRYPKHLLGLMNILVLGFMGVLKINVHVFRVAAQCLQYYFTSVFSLLVISIIQVNKAGKGKIYSVKLNGS